MLRNVLLDMLKLLFYGLEGGLIDYQTSGEKE